MDANPQPGRTASWRGLRHDRAGGITCESEGDGITCALDHPVDTEDQSFLSQPGRFIVENPLPWVLQGNMTEIAFLLRHYRWPQRLAAATQLFVRPDPCGFGLLPAPLF